MPKKPMIYMNIDLDEKNDMNEIILELDQKHHH